MSITKVNHNVTSTAIISLKQGNSQSDITNKSELASTISSMQDTTTIQNGVFAAAKNQPSEEELNSITTELNNCMKSMNTGIGFSLHKETDTLMVQVEDVTTNKVLKEYPAHEFLDQVARIRDCVGVFLDKMA